MADHCICTAVNFCHCLIRLIICLWILCLNISQLASHHQYNTKLSWIQQTLFHSCFIRLQIACLWLHCLTVLLIAFSSAPLLKWYIYNDQTSFFRPLYIEAILLIPSIWICLEKVLQHILYLCTKVSLLVKTKFLYNNTLNLLCVCHCVLLLAFSFAFFFLFLIYQLSCPDLWFWIHTVYRCYL